MNPQSHMQVGTWATYQQPRWAERLEQTSDYIIENTGLTKERLYEVLQLLDDYNIIR